MGKARNWKDRGMTSRGQRTKCICPRCKKVHKIVMYWSGDGTPKKYCKDCKSSYEYRHGYEEE